MRKLSRLEYMTVRCDQCKASVGSACIFPRSVRPTFHLVRRLAARRHMEDLEGEGQ